MKKLTIRHARKVLQVVDAGLCQGIGRPEPGHLCVEAAVCLALGLPHGDEPECVAPPDRAFKIQLNDARWSTNKARAAGLRRVAVMQLGTDGQDRREWARILAELTIRRVLPVALRAVGLTAAATRCKKEGTTAAAAAAADAARAAGAFTASDAAAYAASADSAARAAHAASAATSAARAAFVAHGVTTIDRVLVLAAQCAEEAYERTGSPGVTLLRRIEAGE